MKVDSSLQATGASVGVDVEAIVKKYTSGGRHHTSSGPKSSSSTTYTPIQQRNYTTIK
jgi:hypothetical protein